MKWFRQQTMAKPILMGRKTYESIGMPLPGRTNVVVTRDKSFTADGCLIANDADQALQLVGDADEVMIIGGATFYAQMLERADRLYLTLVHADVEGDAHFPDFDMSQWQESERFDHQADENNPYDYSFVVLQRR